MKCCSAAQVCPACDMSVLIQNAAATCSQGAWERQPQASPKRSRVTRRDGPWRTLGDRSRGLGSGADRIAPRRQSSVDVPGILLATARRALVAPWIEDDVVGLRWPWRRERSGFSRGLFLATGFSPARNRLVGLGVLACACHPATEGRLQSNACGMCCSRLAARVGCAEHSMADPSVVSLFPKTQNLRDCRSHPPSPAPCLVSGLRAARGGDCCETEMRSTAMLSHAKPAWPCQCQATPTPSLPSSQADRSQQSMPRRPLAHGSFPTFRRQDACSRTPLATQGVEVDHQTIDNRCTALRRRESQAPAENTKTPRPTRRAPFASPPRPFPETMPLLLS